MAPEGGGCLYALAPQAETPDVYIQHGNIPPEAQRLNARTIDLIQRRFGHFYSLAFIYDHLIPVSSALDRENG